MTTTYKNRYINRGILDDEEINGGGLTSFTLAAGLMVLADDQGRLSGSTKWIWKEVFKHQPAVSLVACRKAFAHLSQVARFVLTYRYETRELAVIRNWHRYQPQKVDRFRWSNLPAPPGFVPEIHLPPRLLAQWELEKNMPSFSPPPISNEWICGSDAEPYRFRNVSGGGDTAETSGSQPRNSGGAYARAPVDVGKSGQSGRSGRHTRGDVQNVGVAAPPPEQASTSGGLGRGRKEADPDLQSSTAVHENGHSGSRAPASDWSDWERLTDGQRQLRLTNWLWYEKHHWSSVKLATRNHELPIAYQIASFAIDGPILKQHLEAWWTEADPDDPPSSFEYFWTRLQQLESTSLKNQRRPHARESGFSKLGEGLTDIQPPKPSQPHPDQSEVQG